jgi:hypothetical protein
MLAAVSDITPEEYKNFKELITNTKLRSTERMKMLEFLKEAWNKLPKYVSPFGPKFCNFDGVTDFDRFRIVPAFSKEIVFFLNGNNYLEEEFSFPVEDTNTNITTIIESFRVQG